MLKVPQEKMSELGKYGFEEGIVCPSYLGCSKWGLDLSGDVSYCAAYVYENGFFDIAIYSSEYQSPVDLDIVYDMIKDGVLVKVEDEV